jgi:putative endonuclease
MKHGFDSRTGYIFRPPVRWPFLFLFDMEYIIYVLESTIHDIRYVGMTIDLDRRLTEHNQGKSKFTSSYRPWIVIYTETAPDRTTARTREKYLKSSAGRTFVDKHRLGHVPFTDETQGSPPV